MTRICLNSTTGVCVYEGVELRVEMVLVRWTEERRKKVEDRVN